MMYPSRLTRWRSRARTWLLQQLLLRLGPPLRPCHVTGMHDSSHTDRQLCSEQLAKYVRELLDRADLTHADLPRALHVCCGPCHRVPESEKHREHARAIHRWAGAPISDELAEAAPDVPRPGDDDLVYDALTDTFETWQVVIRRLSGMPIARYWAAIRTLEGQGRVKTGDVSARRAVFVAGRWE